MRALFLILLMAAPASAQQIEMAGTHSGAYTTAVGAAWVPLTGASLTTSTDRAVAATLCFVSVTIRNTHGTQSVSLLKRSQAGAGTGVGEIVIPAGMSATVSMYGEGVTTISIMGSGAATTLFLNADLKGGGC